MNIIAILLLLAALIAFLIATFGVTLSRINLVALGLACITLLWFLRAIGVHV